jgi:hypothetical protein
MRIRHAPPPFNRSGKDQSSEAVVIYTFPNTTDAILCPRPLNKYILSLIYTLHQYTCKILLYRKIVS